MSVGILGTDNFISNLLATGIVGGAIGVALIGMLGGHGLSGMGPKWLRWVSGLLAFLFTLAAAVDLAFDGSGATERPSKVFCGLLFALLMVLLAAGIGVSMQDRSSERM